MASGRLSHFAPKKISHFARSRNTSNYSAYGFGNCTFWMDAAFGLNTNTNGASVTYWIDRIKGVTMTQTTAAQQPTLTLTDANFNNYPTLKFSGGRNMTFPTTGFPSDFTIVAVYKIIGISVRTNDLLIGSDGNSCCISAQLTSHGERLTKYDSSNFGASVNNTASHISILTSSDIYRDGASVASGGTATGLLAATQMGNNSASNRNLNSDVAEVLIYSKKLTTTEMVSLSSNINSKYAIY